MTTTGHMKIECLNCGGTHPAVYAVDICWESRPEYPDYAVATYAPDADTYSGHPGQLVDRCGPDEVREALAEAIGTGYGTVKFDREEYIPTLHLRQAVLIAESNGS